MEINWGGYRPFDPPFAKPHHEMTRKEARADFDAVVGSIGERLSALSGLLERNGIVLQGNLSPDDLSRIEKWYRDNLSGDASTQELRPYWYGVSHDIGVYLGQCLIARCPWLKWELVTAPRSDFAFHQPVVAGFRNAGFRMHVDPIPQVLGLGFRVAFDAPEEGEADYLTDLLARWSKLA